MIVFSVILGSIALGWASDAIDYLVDSDWYREWRRRRGER